MSFPVRTVLQFIVLAFLCLSTEFAADAQIPEEKRSVICFDIRISEIRKGNLYQQIDGDAYLSKLAAQLKGLNIDLLKIDRVFGSFGLPQSHNQITEMKPGDALPSEGFVRIEFSEPEELSRLYDVALGLGKTDTLDGMEVLRHKAWNTSTRKIDNTTLEIATDLYAVQEGRDFRSPALAAAWSKLPASEIRLAGDLESARIFVDEIIDRLGEGFLSGAYLPLKNISVFGLALGIESPVLVYGDIEANDEAGATALQTGLMVWQGMPAFWIRNGVEHTRVPRAKKIGNQIANDFKFIQKGNELELRVEKPEGFDETFVRFAKFRP